MVSSWRIGEEPLPDEDLGDLGGVQGEGTHRGRYPPTLLGAEEVGGLAEHAQGAPDRRTLGAGDEA